MSRFIEYIEESIKYIESDSEEMPEEEPKQEQELHNHLINPLFVNADAVPSSVANANADTDTALSYANADTDTALSYATEANPYTEDVTSAKYWSKSKTFAGIKDKETQIKYYMRMESSKEVLQLVGLDSKPFGSESEKMICEILQLSPRTSSQNDGTRNGKKIEIKSARYWACKDDCRWQHLEPDHDYEYALFALLDFNGWKRWGIKKSMLMGEMREKNIVTFQGKQGWWVCKSKILPYLTPIKSVSDLDEFLSK